MKGPPVPRKMSEGPAPRKKSRGRRCQGRRGRAADVLRGGGRCTVRTSRRCRRPANSTSASAGRMVLWEREAVGVVGDNSAQYGAEWLGIAEGRVVVS